MKSVFQNVLAVFLVAVFGAVLVLYIARPPAFTEGQAALFNTMLGALVSTFVGVVQYYFGSSRGSSDKDETLQKIITNGTVVPHKNEPAAPH